MSWTNKERLERAERALMEQGAKLSDVDEQLGTISERLDALAAAQATTQAEAKEPSLNLLTQVVEELDRETIATFKDALLDLQTQVNDLAEIVEVMGLEGADQRTLREDLNAVMAANKQTAETVDTMVTWIGQFSAVMSKPIK